MLNSKLRVSGAEYIISGVIGEGGAGVVYLATNREKELFALKMVNDYSNPVVKESVDTEIKIQKSFKGNKYVIQYIGVEYDILSI